MARNGRKIGDKLTGKQIRAIEALLVEPTTGAAARAAGVGETTIFRWLANPVFDRAYREARSRLFESALTALQSASVDAAKVLHTVLNDQEAPKSVRVSAARTVLEMTLKAREVIETEERLSALERRLGLKAMEKVV